MNWLDSHCHLNDKAFKDDLNDVLNRMVENNINKAMIISSYIDDYNYGLTISNPNITFKHSLGIYPGDVDDIDDKKYEEYVSLMKSDLCDAIGEIGLDYHYGKENKERQKEIFEKQVILAEEINKPIIVHTREAIGDTYDILSKHKCRGVLHCYSDSAQMAKLFVKLGYYISISGTVTWKNAKEPLEVIRTVPLDRLLIETDCPYLSPAPMRGKRNEPSYVVYTGKKISEELGISEELFKTLINDNYEKAFAKI